MSRIVVHVPDLVALASELRRVEGEFEASGRRLARIADDLPPEADAQRETIGRAVSRIRRIAAELRDEAADLARRSELVQDHVAVSTVQPREAPRWEPATLDDRRLPVDPAESGPGDLHHAPPAAAQGAIALDAGEASGIVDHPPEDWQAIRSEWDVDGALRGASAASGGDPSRGSPAWPSDLEWNEAGKGSLDTSAGTPDWAPVRQDWQRTDRWS